MCVVSYTFQPTLCLVEICTNILRSFSKWKNFYVKRVKADTCNDLQSSVPTFYVETTLLLLPYLFDFGLELVIIDYKKKCNVYNKRESQ